jgi:hypothetical protein
VFRCRCSSIEAAAALTVDEILQWTAMAVKSARPNGRR